VLSPRFATTAYSPERSGVESAAPPDPDGTGDATASGEAETSGTGDATAAAARPCRCPVWVPFDRFDPCDWLHAVARTSSTASAWSPSSQAERRQPRPFDLRDVADVPMSRLGSGASV
jgi:hypothetical protein